MISRWGYEEDFAGLAEVLPGCVASLHKKRILVTGATGLVGTCLTEFLAYLKATCVPELAITALSSSADRLQQRLGHLVASSAVELLARDIRDGLPPGQSYDYIIHAAGVANPQCYIESPVNVIDVTVQGTKSMLQHCARQQESGQPVRMLYVSSVEVYGEAGNPVDGVDENTFGSLNPFLPRSSYTESKRLAEAMCMAYYTQYRTDCVVARLCKTYGPSNSDTDSRIMAYLLDRAVSRQKIVMNSDGSRVFSFCYVTDAVSGLLVALLAGSAGQAYNVADRRSVASLREIARETAELAQVSVEFGQASPVGVSVDAVVNCGKLEQLGWRPLTDIRQGLAKQYRAAMTEKSSRPPHFR